MLLTVYLPLLDKGCHKLRMLFQNLKYSSLLLRAVWRLQRLQQLLQRNRQIWSTLLRPNSRDALLPRLYLRELWLSSRHNCNRAAHLLLLLVPFHCHRIYRSIARNYWRRLHLGHGIRHVLRPNGLRRDGLRYVLCHILGLKGCILSHHRRRHGSRRCSNIGRLLLGKTLLWMWYTASYRYATSHSLLCGSLSNFLSFFNCPWGWTANYRLLRHNRLLVRW